MPLFETAQTHTTTFNMPPSGLYRFDEVHRVGWAKFWQTMKGDVDKIVDWAKTAEIKEPEGWTNELYKFLFGNYSGSLQLLRKAAKADFSGFIAQVAENHLNDPRVEGWYTNRGVTLKSFVSVLEKAAAVTDVEQAVHYLNGRIRDFGFQLYDEYLLSKAGHFDELKSVASQMRKRSYEMEYEHAGVKQDYREGDLLAHLYHPGDEFRMLGESGGILITEDQDGHACYIPDPWNTELLFRPTKEDGETEA